MRRAAGAGRIPGAGGPLRSVVPWSDTRESGGAGPDNGNLEKIFPEDCGGPFPEGVAGDRAAWVGGCAQISGST
ncbi:hypothetical protein Stsp01_12130 [Streptomyces sp. NBRC 13847]|nr:hypothetical protein Stsp01_12130 [Streptomyces sp. NBRC 13847]